MNNPTVSKLIEHAAIASDMFGDDELERYAAEQRAASPATLTSRDTRGPTPEQRDETDAKPL